MHDFEYDRHSSNDRIRGGWEARKYRQETGHPVVNLYPHSEQWQYTGRKRPRQERPSAPLIAAKPCQPVVAVTHWRDSESWEGMDAARAEWEAERLTRKLICKHESVPKEIRATSLGAGWRRKNDGWYHICECGQCFRLGTPERTGRSIMIPLIAG